MEGPIDTSQDEQISQEEKPQAEHPDATDFQVGELHKSQDSLGSPFMKNPEISDVADLEAVYNVPLRIQAVLGKTTIEMSKLLHLEPGTVLELDRKVGEAIDIYVNDRLVARGEIVIVDEQLGVTMTEIIKNDRN